MNSLLLTVPLAPLVAALLVILFLRRLPRVGGWIIAAGSLISLLALLILFGQDTSINANWAETGGLALTVGLTLDNLSLFMALIVAGVALLINLYSVAYMADEAGRAWFYAIFSFFIGAMLVLVLANSFLLLFAAWEGVGLASFLLIGFWYKEEKARRAAQKAFLLTRLGDVGFLAGWLLALLLVGTTEIAAFLAAVEGGTLAAGTLTLLALLFLAGAVGKSAQLPLTAWLPAAMVGPTPVSALIHSATMVAAGIYLLLRLFPLFETAPDVVLTTVLWIGGVTALFAALIATVQVDLKRILAWSTVSQLGEMMLALGVGGPLAAAYHLATHATFKSTLFLAAGAIEHEAGSRDLRRLGRLARKLPITGAVFGLAALALAGVPPLSGFWSEDKILAEAVAVGPVFGMLMILLIFLAGVYISRAGAAIFLNWPDAPAPNTGQSEMLMKAPLVLLALIAAGLGWFLSGRLESFLAFEGGPEIGLIWRLLAVAASLAGLGFGVWRVWVSGPAPAFGSLPGIFEQGVEVATSIPAQIAFVFSRGLDKLESALDVTARIIASVALAFAQGLNPFERGLDRTAQGLADGVLALAAANNRSEQALDLAAFKLGQISLTLARASDTVESRGFSDLLDDFANLFNQAGGQLRNLQSGKIYLYTLGLFIWVLFTGILGVLFWG